MAMRGYHGEGCGPAEKLKLWQHRVRWSETPNIPGKKLFPLPEDHDEN
jgi:hypothetical protein